MPDRSKVKGLLRHLFLPFATHKLEDPRPTWAAKPVTRRQQPRGPELTPGGGGGPLPPTPAPEPTPKPATAIRNPVAFNKAARTPEDTARLERGAALRRQMDADQEARAREGLATAHQERAERVRRRLDQDRATPDDRRAAAADLDQQFAAAADTLDAHFERVRAGTTTTIEAADQAGYFSDTLETMLSVAFERANGLEAGRGDNPDGRALGD